MIPRAVLRRLEDVASTIDPALFVHPGSAALQHAIYAAWPGAARVPLSRRELVDWCRGYAAVPAPSCGTGTLQTTDRPPQPPVDAHPTRRTP